MNDHVPALDGIRAVAVLAVLVFHAESLSPGAQRFQGGFLGVSVFFTLSGFLIAGQVLREHERTGTVALAPFASRRIARLAPAALVTIVAVVVLSRTPLATWSVPQGFAPADAIGAVWQFTNWQLAWLPAAAGFRLVHPLTHFWSLAVEVQLYAVLAFAVWLGRDKALRPLLRRLAVCGWSLSLVMALVLHTTVRREEFGTDVRLAEFAAGVLLAVALPRITGQAVQRFVAAAGALAAAVFLGTVLFVGREEFWLANGGYAALSVVWVAWIAAAHLPGPVRRVFSWMPLVQLGTLSYSLYLVHWPIVLALPDSRLGVGGWWAVGIRVAISLAVTVVLHRLVERPLRQRLAPLPAVRLTAAWVTASAVVSVLSLALLSG